MDKIKKKLLGLCIALASFLPFPAFAQSSGQHWLDGHILSAAMMQTLDQAKLNISSIGQPGYAAKLDSFGSLLAPINSLGLRWPAAPGIGYGDVTRAYNNAANNERIIFPCGSIWPAYGNTPRPTGPHTNGKHVEWDLSCNGNWSDNEGWGTQLDNPVGDGDLTLSSINGGRWFMRQDTAQDNGQPVVNIVGVFNNQATCFWSGGVSCNEPVFQSIATIEPGATTTPEAGVFTVNNYARNPWSQQPQGLMIHANNFTDSSMWGLVVETNDRSYLPPQTFSQINEFDAQGNGFDVDAAQYAPNEATRKLIYVSPVTYSSDVGQYSFGMKVNKGDLVAAGSVSNDQLEANLYQAQNAGTASSSQVPAWPSNIGDTVNDNGIIWKKINTYNYQIGVGLWFNHDPGTIYTTFADLIAGNALVTDAAINLSQVQLERGNSAGIRLRHDMPLDFSGNATEDSKNQHMLQYSTYNGNNSLVYSMNGLNAFWIRDTQEILNGVATVFQGGCGSGFAVTPDKGFTICSNAHSVGETDLVHLNGSSVQISGRDASGNISGVPEVSIDANSFKTFIPLSLDNGKIASDGAGNFTVSNGLTAGVLTTAYDANINGNLSVRAAASFTGNCANGSGSTSALDVCANAHSLGEADLILPKGGGLHVTPRNSDGSVNTGAYFAIDGSNGSLRMDSGQIVTDGKGNLTSSMIVTAGVLHSVYDTNVGGNLTVGNMATIKGSLVIPFGTPASSTAGCTPGQLEADANYLYTCVATNTWHRVANGSTW